MLQSTLCLHLCLLPESDHNISSLLSPARQPDYTLSVSYSTQVHTLSLRENMTNKFFLSYKDGLFVMCKRYLKSTVLEKINQLWSARSALPCAEKVVLAISFMQILRPHLRLGADR